TTRPYPEPRSVHTPLLHTNVGEPILHGWLSHDACWQSVWRSQSSSMVLSQISVGLVGVHVGRTQVRVGHVPALPLPSTHACASRSASAQSTQPSHFMSF